MEAQNTIAQIVTICLAFNQNLICMSRISIQGEVRYRNLSFKTWYIVEEVLTYLLVMKIYLPVLNRRVDGCILSLSAHRTPNFTNLKYFACLFLSIFSR